jgi:serine/threonine protein kinase/TolB-like protein/Tfp pilus assembly protein PilF
MTPERLKQADELVEAALKHSPDERAGFLHEACAGDEELRREVESLLAYDSRAESFLEEPALKRTAALIEADRAESLVGRRIGHYEIISKIGRGGMGDVYLARDTSLDRRVALKLLPADFMADAERVRRFTQEAKAASALDHPNVCTIHEVVQSSSFLFIAMQYVDGSTLKQLIGSRPLKLDALLSISLQAADALEAAHEQGIIHRDIKSDNIMVTPKGQAKILDFGLAKLTVSRDRADGSVDSPDATSRLTMTGVVMGTPSYMSPEQARGEHVDHRSDIFSLGVVIHEMATGDVPFKRKSPAETMNAVINERHTPVAEVNEQIPPALSAVIDRALSKDLAGRYQSAGEMLSDLRHVGRAVGLLGASDSEGAVIPHVPLVRRPDRRWMWPIILLGLALLVGTGLWLFSLRTVSQPPLNIGSLVVLPLENLSGDPQQEYFADGMTDALITELAKISALRIIARTSAMSYKGTKKSLPEIARELKVDAVVEGTVQRAGDRVGIRVQLIQPATDRHLWVESYERDLRDVLGLQSQIARAIAREIQTKVTSSEQVRLAHNRSVNRKAFDDHLQGRYLYWNMRTKENLEKAIEYFQSAINADPTYAPAYVGLADCYNLLGTEQIGALPPIESRRKAEEAAGEALELDGELAEAHAALGWVKHFNWEWAAAEREFKLAIELNPNHANGHLFYAGFLASSGRLEEGIGEVNRAQELDPFSLAISAQRGFILENARRYDEAIEQLRRVIAVDPNRYPAHWYLGHTYAASGRFNEAIAAFEKAAALSGRSPGALGFLGLAYGLEGRKDEANKVLKELLDLQRRRYVSPPALANVYIGLGNNDQAFFWLERAYQERSNYMAWLKVFPLLDPLRSDPRFDDLLRRIGLAP